MEDFDSCTRYKLSYLLEPKRMPSYWPQLAAQLHIDRYRAQLLTGKDEPVMQLFELYECTDMNASIPAIYDACIAIERYDTLKHFKKFQDVEVCGKCLLPNIFFLFNHESFCDDGVKGICFYDVANFGLYTPNIMADQVL